MRVVRFGLQTCFSVPCWPILLQYYNKTHFNVFIACVSDRFILKQVEGSGIVKCFIQTFTRCFLRELALLPQQVGPSFQIKYAKFIHNLVKTQVDVEKPGDCCWRRNKTPSNLKVNEISCPDLLILPAAQFG